MFKQARRYNKNPQRRKVPGVGAENMLARRTPIGVDSVIFGGSPGSTCDVTFDGPAFWTGILPAWEGPTGQTVTGVSVVGGSVLRFSWSASITTADEITIPFEDPSVRNTAGGYVRPPVVVAAV